MYAYINGLGIIKEICGCLYWAFYDGFFIIQVMAAIPYSVVISNVVFVPCKLY